MMYTPRWIHLQALDKGCDTPARTKSKWLPTLQDQLINTKFKMQRQGWQKTASDVTNGKVKSCKDFKTTTENFQEWENLLCNLWRVKRNELQNIERCIPYSTTNQLSLDHVTTFHYQNGLLLCYFLSLMRNWHNQVRLAWKSINNSWGCTKIQNG